MVFGLFVERNPHVEVLKLDDFMTLLWRYKIGYNVSMLVVAALLGAIIGYFLGGFIFVIFINNSEVISFIKYFSGILGAILFGVLSYNMQFGFSKILISKDGIYVSADSNDGKVYFFNKDGQLIWREKMDDDLISSSFDGAYTAIGSQNKLKLIDVNGNLLWDFGYRTGGLFGSDALLKGVSVSADGSHIAAVFDSSDYEGWWTLNKILLFDHRKNRLWDFDMNTSGTIIGASISSDGSSVAVVKDNGVLFFNKEGKLLWEYKKDMIKGCSISSDGSYLAVISNYEVHLLNREGRFLWSDRTDGMIRCVIISSDGSYIAAGSDDNTIYFFNNNGNLLWRYKTDGAIQSVAISPDHSFIVAGSRDNSVYILNVDGVILGKYKTGGEVNIVSVSPDGSYIAVGTEDKEVYFFKFDMEETGKLKT